MSREERAPKEAREKKAEKERERDRERERDNLPPHLFLSPAAAVALASVSTSKPISCGCKRSKCLKLYCDCFRFSKFCDGCVCNDCANKGTREEERTQAIAVILERNPDAFKPIVKEVRLDINYGDNYIEINNAGNDNSLLLLLLMRLLYYYCHIYF
jgi:Tesmin/TSO1-like CXC domain, cysteine-rich domain